MTIQQHGFVQLPVVLETTGGMGPHAETLVHAMASASAERLGVWTREGIIREVVGSLAIAVQRGNAMSYLEGHERSLHVALTQHAASMRQSAEQDEGTRYPRHHGGRSRE